MPHCARLILAASALIAAGAWAQPSAPLRVCLPEGSAPYSEVEQGRGRGFDLALLAAAARRLGRDFEPVWFESRYDSQGNLSLDARALLAAGACDLVAGIPLYEPHLVAKIAEKARTPDYPGAKPLRQRPWQTLVPVAGGAPYRAAALALIAREEQDASVATIGMLKGRTVAVRAGSMASMALGAWHSGEVASSIRGYNLLEDVLGALEAGQTDFALVDIGAWDRHRAAHPQSTLRRTAFDDPLKINIGLLARSTDAALLRELASSLSALSAAGVTASAANAALVTWMAPVMPAVRPVLSLRDFQ